MIEQRQPRGTPAVSRPGGSVIPLPPRRRPDPAAATDGDQQAFRPPEETEQETGGWREALNDFFSSLMAMGSEMARAGSQPGASFGGALAQGIGQGGAAFDASQRQRQEDQRRARLEAEEKLHRADQLQLARDRLEQQGIQGREANRLAHARLKLQEAAARRDPVVAYEVVEGQMIGFTRSGQQVKTGVRPARSAKDLNSIVESAKSLSVRMEVDPLTGKQVEMYDPALMSQSLRLLGQDDLAQRFEQQRDAQPLQDGQVVSVPEGSDRHVGEQVLRGGWDYRYNARTRTFEPL